MVKKLDRRQAVSKALSMKAAAIESIINKTVSGTAKAKTLAFIDHPYDKLVEEIQQGRYALWRRKKS